MLIFLVDEYNERQEILRLGLKMAGYEVRSVATNVEALGCLVQELIGQDIVELIVPRQGELGLARRISIQQSSHNQEMIVTVAAFGYFPLPECSHLRQTGRNKALFRISHGDRLYRLIHRLIISESLGQAESINMPCS